MFLCAVCFVLHSSGILYKVSSDSEFLSLVSHLLSNRTNVKTLTAVGVLYAAVAHTIVYAGASLGLIQKVTVYVWCAL